MRTPDESRLVEIAKFFDVTVEYLRRDHRVREGIGGSGFENVPYIYPDHAGQGVPALREPESPPYGLPSLRRDDNLVSGSHVAELAIISARLMGMIGSTTKGVADGKFDIGNSIIILRRLGDILEQKLREADSLASVPPASY